MHHYPFPPAARPSGRRVSLSLLAALAGFATALTGRAQLASTPTDQTPLGAVPPVVAAPPSAKSDNDMVVLNPFEVSSAGDRGYQAQNSLGGSRLKTDLKNIASPTTAFTAQFLEDAAITNSDDLAKYMLSTEYDVGEDSGGQNRLGPSNRPLRVRGLAGGSYSVNFFRSDLRFDTFSLDRIDQSRGPNSVLFGVGSPGGIINVTTKRAILTQEKGSVTVQGTTEKGLREEVDFNQPIINGKLALRVAAVNTQEETWRNYEYDDQQRYFATLKWRIGEKTELNVEGEKGAIDKATKRTVTGYDAYTNWVAAGRNLSATASVPLQVARVIAATTPNYFVFDTAVGSFENWAAKTKSVLRQSVDAEAAPITDFNLVPKETTFYGPGYNQSTSYDRTSAYLTHSFTPQWNVELAAFRFDRHGQVWDAQGAAQNYLNVDTNPTLPNGTVNPNAGKPYLESITQVNNTSSRDDALRAIMSYQFDLGSIFGKHTLAGVGEADYGRSGGAVLREQIISANAPNATLEDNNNRVFRRTYVNLAGPSDQIVMRNFQAQPINNVISSNGQTYTTGFVPFNQNTALNSYHGTSAIGMLQSSFWKDRVNTVVGGSYDERSDFQGTQTRTPFANFASGILTPIRSHTALKSHAHSFSLSGVFHVTDWLGLTYSRSENSSLPNFTGRIHSPDGVLPNINPPTPRGKSQDAGIKLDVWQHKVFLTATYFKTSDVQDFDFTPLVTSVVNPIWTTMRDNGVPVPTGYVYDQVITRGGAQTIQDISTGATFEGATHGLEFELTANPTENWRVFANFSHQTTTHSNIGPEELAYLALWRPLWNQYAALPLNTGTGTIGSQLVALDNNVLSNFILASGKEPLGQSKDKFSLRTAYDLTQGWVKGITVGGGARYNSSPVIGYFPSLDSTGKTVANVRHGTDQIFFDANVSYRRKFTAFKHSVLWTLQLNANNVLNNDSVVNLRVSTIGEVELYKFNPEREWLLSSKFDF